MAGAANIGEDMRVALNTSLGGCRGGLSMLMPPSSITKRYASATSHASPGRQQSPSRHNTSSRHHHRIHNVRMHTNGRICHKLITIEPFHGTNLSAGTTTLDANIVRHHRHRPRRRRRLVIASSIQRLHHSRVERPRAVCVVCCVRVGWCGGVCSSVCGVACVCR